MTRGAEHTLVPFIGFLLLGWCYKSILAIPMQVTINQRQHECLYDTLEADEAVTLSVFVLSGPELKGTVMFQGPLASSSVDTAEGLQAAVTAYTGPKGEGIDFTEVVDFEHLKPEVDSSSDDDDDTVEEIDPSDPDADEKRKKQRERRREKFMAAKKKRDEQRALQQQKIREDGEPFVKTFKAPSSGWYRVCVHASSYQIVSEMELRKASELGGIDEDGHVITYEQKTMNEEDKLLEEDTASQEGIKDEDFEDTRQKIKDLRRMLNEIQSMQQKERRRLTVHAETNEHSYSRMVLNSLFETVLFMVVTGYQVYTIRKWFSGSPVLGR